MSNPEPNLPPRIDRERHMGPIVGMVLVVVFALVLIFWWMMDESANAPGPDTPVEVNSSTTINPTEPDAAGDVDVDVDVAPAPAPEPAPEPAPTDAPDPAAPVAPAD